MSWLKLKNLIQSMDKRRKGSKRGEAFEELVVRLLRSFLKIPFVRARSGSQPSGDARSLTGNVSIQAKNYSNSENLRIESIVRDIHRAKNKLQDLEVYVLAVSSDSAQLHDELDEVERETFLDIVVLELTDKLSDIAALCVTYWADIQDFQEFSKNHQNQDFFDWLEVERQDSKTEKKIQELQRKIEQCIQTQIHFQKDAKEHLLRCIGAAQDDNPRSNRSIDLSKAKDRHSLESKMKNWWERETEPVCYLEGEESSGKSWLAAKWVKSVCEDENIVLIWLESNRWSGCESLDDLLEACFKSIYGSQVEKQIPKLKHKICNIWDLPTLIILDGLSERESTRTIKAILDEYFEEYHNGRTKWGHKIRLLLTTRPFEEHQSSEDYLWKGCCPIQVEPFGDTEPQTALVTEDPQLINTSNPLSTIAEIPRYSQICTRLQSQFDSFDMEMVLWTDLLEKIEHTEPPIREEFGWSQSENAQEILVRLVKQPKWANVDTATQVSAQFLKKCFADYRKTRRDIEEQSVALEPNDAHTQISQDHIVLGWALYLSNLFDSQNFTTIKDFADRLQRELGPILSEDPRTESLFVTLQISAIFPRISQKSLSQKRSTLILMLARFNNYNPQFTDERLLFWAEQDTDAYAQAVEFEFRHHNSPNYEEVLIGPLAKVWLNKKGQLNYLASYLTKWLFPTDTDHLTENVDYINHEGNPFPTMYYTRNRLLAAALSILSQRTENQFLATLANCYENLASKAQFRDDIGRLMRWGYNEEVLGNLHWLAELAQHDERLLEGIYGLAANLALVDLPPLLQRPLSEKELETRNFVKQHNRRFKSYIGRIRNEERLLIGDSPAANGNYHGLDYLAVRTDLPNLHHEDLVEIKKILKDISVSAELGWSRGATLEDFCIENLIPWIAKYDFEGYAELACSIKLNALNQKWAQFKLLSIQALIFKPEDRERITEAILDMKVHLAQDRDFYPDIEWLTSLLTEYLLFCASEEVLTNWFEFLASHELLRISICYKPLPSLIEILLPESIVRLAQRKLEVLWSSSNNQNLSKDGSEEYSEEEFWWTLYAYGPRCQANTVESALEKLKLKKPDSTGTFPLLLLALSNPKRFLDETLIDEKIQKHLFSEHGRQFIPHTYDEGKNVPSYEVLRSFLPPEIVGSFLCLPDRRGDLSRSGKELMQWMCSILQGTEGDSNSVKGLRFGINREVLEIWAEQNKIDFLQLANEYLIKLSKSPRYRQTLSDFTDTILCLLLRFQPYIAMRYYHQWNTEGIRTIYSTHYGVETFFAQLWQVEDCRLVEHRNLRRKLLEECSNDEEIMFMTLAALAGGGREELWSLVKEKYSESHSAKERNLGVSILPWFGTCAAIDQLKRLKSEDPSQWVREHATWAYEVAQQERSCQKVYREALQTRDLFRISAVFEQIKPALAPTARWWRERIEKEEELYAESQEVDPKLLALVYRFWYRWGDSTQTKRNIEVFGRKLREYCRGEKLSAGSTPRIAPWWKPTSNFDS